MINNKLEMGQ